MASPGRPALIAASASRIADELLRRSVSTNGAERFDPADASPGRSKIPPCCLGTALRPGSRISGYAVPYLVSTSMPMLSRKLVGRMPPTHTITAWLRRR